MVIGHLKGCPFRIVPRARPAQRSIPGHTAPATCAPLLSTLGDQKISTLGDSKIRAREYAEAVARRLLDAGATGFRLGRKVRPMWPPLEPAPAYAREHGHTSDAI